MTSKPIQVLGITLGWVEEFHGVDEELTLTYSKVDWCPAGHEALRITDGQSAAVSINLESGLVQIWETDQDESDNPEEPDKETYLTLF